MARSVELFYDFSSPNAYFAAMQLPELAARHGARVLWRPIFLGGLFRSLGVHLTPGMSTPGKAAHSRRDLERWSERYKVPFRFASRFPVGSVRALRAALVLEQAGVDAQRWAQTVFRACWVDDRDIADPIVLGTLLAGLGVDAAAVLAEIEEPRVKDALRRATDEAAGRGVFGAPTMIVGGELYFGKDRLDFVEEDLRSAHP